jgi:carboxylate-amine ligase
MRERSAVPAAISQLDPTTTGLFDRFGGLSPLTIGIEEELLLVDAETLEPCPVAEPLLADLGFGPRFTPEFRACQIELNTPVCSSVREAAAAVAELRGELLAHAGRGVALLAVGAHPFAAPGPVSDRLRYRRIASECAWAARWMLTCGLHVHVAVPGAERALAVCNALRAYLPEIAAVGANSPFWAGEPSGFASVRSRLNATLPRSGIPPAFADLDAYAAFVEWGSASRSIRDPSEHWWDLRLSPEHGTVEVRIPDVQTRPEETAAVAALVHSLVAWLVHRYDAGERLPVPAGERIRENAWLAARDGTSGFLADLETGERQPTSRAIGQLVRELMPIALELGCAGELADLLGLMAESGADRQRRIEAQLGVEELTRWLVDATVPGPSGAADEFEVALLRSSSLVGRRP